MHHLTRRRHLALVSLNLPNDFNELAVDRISRVGPLVFGCKFLEAIDLDLNLNKRAKEDFKKTDSIRVSLFFIFFAEGALPSLK